MRATQDRTGRDRTGWIRLAIWCAGLLCIAPAPAEETATVQTRLLAGGAMLEISGPLMGDAARLVRAAMEEAPNLRHVRLASEGGMIGIGIEVQTAIRARGLDTDVRGQCNSACTLAYLGGARRTAASGARFGFHGTEGAGPHALAAHLITRGMYLHAGVPEAFVDRALAVPQSELWFPSMAELLHAGIVSAVTGDDP